MDVRLASVLLISFSSTRVGFGANILILHPIYSGSHDLVLRSFGEELIERGHRVTQIRFPQKNSKKNTHFNTRVDVMTLPIVDKEQSCSRYINSDGEFDISSLGSVIWNNFDSPYQVPLDVYCTTHLHCKMLVQDPNLFQYLNSSHFDLAIVDLVANECSLVLARALGLPVVSFWGFGYQAAEIMYTSTWNPASLVPSLMTGFDRNMNFLERSVNLMFYLTNVVLTSWQCKIVDKYIQENFPDLESSAKLIHDIDLSLVNVNFYVDYPRLIAPNTKYVGPMHLKDPKPLPTNFRDFVEGSEHGVIIFSLGFTGFLAKDVPRKVMDEFLKAFSRIKQRVIMRFDSQELSYIPDNVMAVDWFPQIDLLGHNNTVLFISHCGMNGVSESVYNRVPILGMPIFADQSDNAAKLRDRGIGLLLDRHNIVADDVVSSIQEMIDNPKYKDTVNKYASMWREERFSAVDEAIYWIELLHKYGNLDHLRINDAEMNLLQYLCLDVVLVWGALLLLLTYVILNAIRSIVLKLWRKSWTSEDLKKKQS